MEIKRVTEISIEKTRRFRIRQPETDETILCPACGESMLAAEASAVLFKIKHRRVYQIVEANAVHFTETETGAVFVCPQSLDAAIADADAAPSADSIKQLTDSAAAIQINEIEVQ